MASVPEKAATYRQKECEQRGIDERRAKLRHAKDERTPQPVDGELHAVQRERRIRAVQATLIGEGRGGGRCAGVGGSWRCA